jgi:histidinol-phosphate aminotransferase
MARAIYGDEEFLKQVKELTISARRKLEDFFRYVGWRFLPSHGNFLMVKPNCGLNAREIVKRLREMGVWINHTAAYGLDGWLRITLGSEAENEHLIKALEKVCGLST